MSLFGQHGHAKGDKLDIALQEGSLKGVILSARNEAPDKVANCISSLSEYGEVLFDPQFFISTFSPPNDRYLPDYPYYQGGLSPASFTGAKKLLKICRDTIDFQMGLGVSRIISPTVYCENFDSKWAQIALNLADTSLDYHSGLDDAPPLLVNFLLSEEAFTSRKSVEGFLDEITSWDMQGVYLVIAREDSTYSQSFEPQRFAHALYLNYVLGQINKIGVVNGFSDFCGLLFRAAGSDVFASGWYQSLRQFSKKAFIKKKAGGAVPRLRYSSGPLLNSIFISELDDIRDAGMLDEVLSGTSYDGLLEKDSERWTQKSSELAHWQSLSSLDSLLSTPFKQRLNTIENAIKKAISLYIELEGQGIVFSNNSGPAHLEGWTEALENFKILIR